MQGSGKPRCQQDSLHFPGGLWQQDLGISWEGSGKSHTSLGGTCCFKDPEAPLSQSGEKSLSAFPILAREKLTGVGD